MPWFALQVKANEAVAAEVVRTIFRQAAKPKSSPPPPPAQGPSPARAPGPAPALERAEDLSPTKTSAASLIVDSAADSVAAKAHAAQAAALAEMAVERVKGG
jgi:hypothetical protein